MHEIKLKYYYYILAYTKKKYMRAYTRIQKVRKEKKQKQNKIMLSSLAKEHQQQQQIQKQQLGKRTYFN